MCLDRVHGWGWGLGDQFGALVGINCTNSNRHLCVWQEKCRSEIINENDIIYIFLIEEFAQHDSSDLHVLNACAHS